MNRRLLIATAVLATGVTAPACLSSPAHAANNCGGNTTSHPAPIDCVNQTTVAGVTGGIHLTVTTTGAIHVDAQVNKPTLQLFLQVKSHVGTSNNATFVGATAVFANGVASLNLGMAACSSQVDIKIVPGTPTLDHVSDIYRVAAPLVELPNCGTNTTTTTTVPQSSTTTTPSSSTVPSSVATTSIPASTPGPVESTAPTTGGGTHSVVIPATGRDSTPLVALAAVFVGLGLLVLLGVRRRAA